MSRIDEIQARLNEAIKVRPYEEQDRDEHKSKAWSDFYQHAPDDLAWLLDAVARRDQRCEDLAVSLDETRAALAADPTDAEIEAAAVEFEQHEQFWYDDDDQPLCECGFRFEESPNGNPIPSFQMHQARAALVAARKARS